jgi:CBS domain-containing protein/nucleotide-binding universal stress UspA family protein
MAFFVLGLQGKRSERNKEVKPMRVGQWMTKDPVTVSPKETIVLARAILRHRGIRRLPVMEGDRLVGIVTDRDLREAWASDASTLSTQELHYLLERIPVRDIMTAPVLTVTPETPLAIAVRTFQEKKIGGCPVVSGGELVGILTETDIFRAFTQVLHTGNVEGRPERAPRPVPPVGKLLVPVLGTPLSPKVVRAAARLAAQLGLSLKLLLAMKSGQPLEEHRREGDPRGVDEIIGDLLTDYRRIAEEEGVRVEAEFQSGEPATVALEAITVGDYDFVVVGRRNHLHLGTSRLELEKNGFAARLLEDSSIPVLVVSEAVQV